MKRALEEKQQRKRRKLSIGGEVVKNRVCGLEACEDNCPCNVLRDFVTEANRVEMMGCLRSHLAVSESGPLIVTMTSGRPSGGDSVQKRDLHLRGMPTSRGKAFMNASKAPPRRRNGPKPSYWG